MNRMSSSMPTELAGASDLAQSVGNAQAVSNEATGGAAFAAGFGASVHQYLNQLLTILYSKTTTLLAANMVLISLLLSTRTSIKIGLDKFYIAAVFCFALSAITSTIVLFPRLRRDNCGGLIFWRSILADGDAGKYYDRVRQLNRENVEEEYARDNFHLAKVIQLKDSLLRCAISCFILGLAGAVIGVVLPILFSHFKG